MFHEKLGLIPLHNSDGSTNVKNVFVVGEAAGLPPHPELLERAALLTVNSLLGKRDRNGEEDLMNLLKEKWPQWHKALLKPYSQPYFEAHPTILGDSKYSFVCFCIDVIGEDIKCSIKRVMTPDIEKVKRDTGLGTGRCQGRLCMQNGVSMIHKYGGYIVGEPRFTIRPPIHPVKISKILGGEEFWAE